MRKLMRMLALAFLIGGGSLLLVAFGVAQAPEQQRRAIAAWLEPYLPMVSGWLYRLTLPNGVPSPPERPHFLDIKLPQRLAQSGFREGMPVFIRILKEEGHLEVHMRRPSGWRLFQIYPICAWSGALGPKLKEGDGQSPEGFYEVTRAALNPNSRYHLSFNLGFPNAFDRAHGRTGSFLMVHGACASIGCYAMTDEGIDDIYKLVEAAFDAGQPSVPVHVFPFRMTPETLAARADNPNAPFWRELAEGWRRFERDKAPPRAFACAGPRYGFTASEGPDAAEGMPGCKRIEGL